MYRINFYHERETRAADARRRMARTVAFGTVVGVEALLIALLVVAGWTLSRKNDNLRRSVTSIRAQAEASPIKETEALRVARAIVQTRDQRLDWLPQFKAVAETIPESLILSEIDSGIRLDSGRPGMNLEGSLSSPSQMETLLGFVDALRANPVISSVFPAINLDMVEAERTRQFRIICRKEAAGNS